MQTEDYNRRVSGLETDLHPKSMVVIDGSCALCSLSSVVLQRWSKESLSVIGRADLDKVALRSIPPEVYNDSSALWWIDRRGGVFRGHRAVLRALSTCGVLGCFACYLAMLRPFEPVVATLYLWLSSHRTALSKIFNLLWPRTCQRSEVAMPTSSLSRENLQ